MSHYLKLLMDCIFGEKNFRNEIIWCFTGPNNSKTHFQRKHNTIFFYGKSKTSIFYPDQIRVKYKAEQPVHLGRGFGNPTEDEIEKIKSKIHKGKIPTSWWAEGFLTNISAWKSQLTGFPTQKPLALLERIINASSKEGDMVLDPFCGCATACVAAEKLGRQWIGVDTGIKAYTLVQTRIKDEVYAEGLIKGENGYLPQIHCRTYAPERTSEDNAEKGRYVYIMTNELLQGLYKVSISKTPEERAKSVLAQAPKPTQVVWKYKTEHYLAIEQYIHKKYPREKEWVKGEIEDIKRDIKNWKPKRNYCKSE